MSSLRVYDNELPTQALAFLAVFVYATHATQAIAFEWKPGLTGVQSRNRVTADKTTSQKTVSRTLVTAALDTISSWNRRAACNVKGS